MKDILGLLESALGPGVVHPGDESGMERFRGDLLETMPQGAFPAAIILPRTVAEVATALRICHAQGVAVTPQGGLTGVVGAAVPLAGGVVLSLERMRAIIELDADSATMTVEAGVPLEAVQQAAAAQGLLFPLDLGARGSCTIGGNAATNAGGNRVLRYGMMRDLVLGLEVVLADGTVITSLGKMIKNNAGFDLRHLFIGSEGTLGVVTRLVLKLFPMPTSACTALCGVESYDGVLALLALARRRLGGTLSAFEVMWPGFHALARGAAVRMPLERDYPCHVLLDALGTDQDADQERFNALLEAALEQGIIVDAVIAQSGKEGESLWALRDCVSEFPRLMGANVSFDISVPTGDIARFIAGCDRALGAPEERRSVWFGHVADANVHLMVELNAGMDKAAIERIVYDAVRDHGGSVSAEHGIGIAKRAYLGHTRGSNEIAVMRLIKQALDPRGILNPGKVLPDLAPAQEQAS
ncbi:MAG TPA: FAD-binding oxidoreductase [Novosphingobium sp.]|nr:FAD-binding oxidoreductase [Novosphingobium sp.]